MDGRALGEGGGPAGSEDAGEPAGRGGGRAGAGQLQYAAAIDLGHGVSPCVYRSAIPGCAGMAVAGFAEIFTTPSCAPFSAPSGALPPVALSHLSTMMYF